MLTPRLPLAAITDEFSPDLRTALAVMREIGMTGVELRMIDGRNIADWPLKELAGVKQAVEEAECKVVSIASPLLKCVLPDGPAVDQRFAQDIFAARHTFADQDRLADQVLAIAEFLEAPLVRVFSFWRTVEPQRCLEPLVGCLRTLLDKFAARGIRVGLENEHACNVATAAETGVVLRALSSERLGAVWDPANALIAGEEPFPQGFRALPAARIFHVHVKDCHLDGHTPVWGPVGTRRVDWKGQIRGLLEAGYRGYLSLETHWPGPNGDKLEASRICGWNLRSLAAV